MRVIDTLRFRNRGGDRQAQEQRLAIEHGGQVALQGREARSSRPGAPVSARQRPDATNRRRFLRVPRRKRWLLIEAAVLLALVRAGLWALPFKVLNRLTRRIGQPVRPSDDGSVPVEAIVWAVRRASMLVPGATCLTQALVGRVLLARAGHGSELRIGVEKSPAAGFAAHAWLEHDGEVVLGELEDLSRFVPLRPPACNRS